MADRIVTVTDGERAVWTGTLRAFFPLNSAALNTGDWRILFRDGLAAKDALLIALAR